MADQLSTLDIDALEHWVNHELEAYSTRTNTWRLAEVLILIQRLRKAEAEFTTEFHLRGIAEQRLGEAEARITQLERVREAAAAWRDLRNKGAMHQIFPYESGLFELESELDAALAAAGEPRLTEKPTAFKAGNDV